MIRSEHDGWKSWTMKYDRVITGIGALRDILKLVDNHFNEILNWFNSGMSNGVMEGINSVIQAAKGRARGFRDWKNLRTMRYLRSSGLCDPIIRPCPN
ncbi:transposase [Methanomethylophilus alvi]|uniref:transposase n=1 Tax=Methanomethylophilus alvi TaxID=1291540 RepID=UPI0037DC663D